MNLVVIAAFIAVCGAAKLDRTYLPPSAASAGGSPGSLQAPFTRTSEQGLGNGNPPTGSFTNEFGDVVVEAAAPGTRSSEGLSGLGGPRPSYGSSNSKVGSAAFRGSVAGFREPSAQIEQDASGRFNNNRNGFQENSQIDSHTAQGFPSIGQVGYQTGQFSNFQDENKSERPQAAKDRSSNILSLSNDVNADSYSYGFETDNGIAVGENGVDVNGIQAEGGYSYQGDDGQVYKVTYVADEKGYRPQGAHLPTPPPIPDEILKSLEQNAKAEAAGIVDDGSYDAQKYNADSDYTHDNSGNNQHNGGQSSQFEKRPVSSTFNQNNQAFGSTGVASFASNSQDFNGQSSQVNENNVGASNTFGSNQDQEKLAQFGISAPRPNYKGQKTQIISQPGSTQFGSQTHSTFEQLGQTSQFESNVAQNDNFGHNSHSSQTVHKSSTGQPFGKKENIFYSSGHTQDALGSQSQFGSQFGQQASATAQFENQAPESGSMQNQQELNTQFSSSSKPTNDQFPQDAINSAHSQSTQPESGTSFKPQGSEAFSGASLNQNQDAQDFGKPFPQIFSGENYNRPSSGNFNRKPTFGQRQVNRGSASSFNRFSQTSGQFAAPNEYLPPSSNGQSIKSQDSEVTSNTGISGSDQEPQKEQIPNFVALNRPKPNFANAPTSTIFKQPQPNQFNQQTTQFTPQTGQPSFQSQAQFNTNSQQSVSFAAQTVTDIGPKPTTVPDAELTTPIEPNEKPLSQGSQFSSQTSSNFGSFDSKPANQDQSQFGFQGNTAFGQSTSQTLSPNAPTSSPQTSSQFGTASMQLAFQSSGEKRPENLNPIPQFNLNSFGQNQQKQPSSSQVIDNSYYYNQPPKAFRVPTPRPQASRFPSSPSYQSNGIAQSQFFNQQSFQTPTKFPASSLPVRPTSATQSVQSQGYNGITQAAASSFPSAFPTQSSQIGMTQTTQFGSMPNFNQQSSTGNQAQSAVAQTSYIQQSTIGNRFQEIDNKKKPTISTLPVARFPPSLQFGLVGTQTHSMGTNPSFNQQPTFSNQTQVTGNQENQSFSQLPTGNFPSGQKPVSTESQIKTKFETSKTSESSEDFSQQSTQTQQYQGTIYEYNKPAEVLPATQTDSSSDQINTSSDSKPSFGQSQSTHSISQQGLKPTSQVSEPDSKSGLQSNKASGSSSSSFQFGQKAQTSQVSPVSYASETQFNIQSAKPFIAPSFTNIEFGQSAQSGGQTNKPYGALAASALFGQTAQLTSDGSIMQQNNQELQSAQSLKPFGSASQSSQSPFGTKIQFGSQTNQFSQSTQSLGNSQPQKTGPQPPSSFQKFQNSASSQGNGYFYPGNSKPQFGEESKNLFNSQPGRPQIGMNNQFNSALQGNSQFTGQQSQFNSASRPQFGSQNNKNTQAIFGQKAPNSPIQPFSQPQFGPSSTTSQAFATGQATASASATSQLKPFDSQDMTQFSNTPNSQDQNGQSTQVGVQSTKPFGTQESKEPSQPFGSHSQASKPLFNSACCQASKDSTSAQSIDRPSSFPGAQSSSQTFAGKGEQFGGPRQPPKFDEQTGYHY